MKPLWLLKGGHTAPGWKKLEEDFRAEEIDLVVFDRAQWALMYADEAPTAYEGLVPTEPADGMYVSEQGQPIYVFGRRELYTAQALVEALGEDAQRKLVEVGDAVTALERLGKVY